MSAFVLVLIVTVNGKPALTTIPGFNSEKACKAAGAQWDFIGQALVRQHTCLEVPRL